MTNPFVHVELATTDLDKSKSFYQSLFSWQLQEMDMGGGMSYTMINVEVACFRVPPNEPTAHRTYAHYILMQEASGGH